MLRSKESIGESVRPSPIKSKRARTYLPVHEAPQVQTLLVSNFDVADVKVVDEILNSLRFSGRGSRQSQDPEPVIVRLKHPNDLTISVIRGSLVGFV